MDLTQFFPAFGNLAFTLLAFVVALSIIVAIHEYGHYIVGRWCGIHAEVFSIGFGPELWSRVDRRGTKWRIAAWPVGGYVRFLGDADPASVLPDGSVPQSELRRSMLGAPLWARVLTVAAGPAFNFLFAMAIFAGSYMAEGRAVEPLTFGEPRGQGAVFESGLEAGDVLISVAGLRFDEGLDRDAVPQEPRLDYTVLRDGREITVEGPYISPPVVGGIVPRSAADDAGLKVGDRITSAGGEEIFAFAQLADAVQGVNGAPIPLVIDRNGESFETVLTPRATDEPTADGGFETTYRIGVMGGIWFEPETERLGPMEAVPAAARAVWRLLTTTLSAMEHILFGQISTCNLSGPVGIAETSGSMASQGAQSFLWFIGALSAGVGLINLFPIPILDGGHLVFHAYEAIARRKPSEAAIRVFMSLGLALIASMMLFTVLNDILLCP